MERENISFEHIKLVMEQHFHFASIKVERDEHRESNVSYVINAYRPQFVNPIAIVQLNKDTGRLEWLDLREFGESGVFVETLLESINDIMERRRSYVTRTQN